MYLVSGTCLQELVPQTLAKTLTSAWETKQGGSPMAGVSGISVTQRSMWSNQGICVVVSF